MVPSRTPSGIAGSDSRGINYSAARVATPTLPTSRAGYVAESAYNLDDCRAFASGPVDTSTAMATSEIPSKPIVILSCSLNPQSRSHKLALAAETFLRETNHPVELVDLAGHDLPMCGSAGSFDHPAVQALTATIDAAGAILVSAPVYNYDLNAAAKNAMELTGSGWTQKPVGFLCAAGGKSSYMSAVGFANSLMFDFRCHIIPRFVYCIRDDFTDAGEPGPDITLRVQEVATSAVDLARALAWVRENPR